MDSYTIAKLEEDLSMINFNNMDHATEMQLAAEIGKILLEKNKQLEDALETKRQLIKEQETEIQKLLQESHSLQVANTTSLQFAEQLETNVAELERMNKTLIKEKSVDQELLKDFKQSKEVLEQQCAHLQDSHECIEDELLKCQNKMENQEKVKEVLQKSLTSVVDAIERQEEETEAQEVQMIQLINGLSSELGNCKGTLETYHQKVDYLEVQLTRIWQKNTELEGMLVSRLELQELEVKSRTSSGCSSSSCKFKNSTSLLEEIVVTQMNSMDMETFNDGCVVTSTPPKSSMKPDTVIEMKDAKSLSASPAATVTSDSGQKSLPSSDSAKSSKHYKKQTKKHEHKRKVRINVCIEIDALGQEEGATNVHMEKRVCQQHKLQHFARSVIATYKKSMVTGLKKVLFPFVLHPQSVLGAFILWSNKSFIEKNIRAM